MTNQLQVDLPYVSIIIPMYNEEQFVTQCLDSILFNNYPKNKFEILVIDGMSTDRSRDIVKDYAKHYLFIRLIETNIRINRAAALNLGISKAKGEIIVRMDAHTFYAVDYIRKCVELLLKTTADNVGGSQRSRGTNYISRAIAIATTVPFGVGDAYFRYAEKMMWLDTVYLGAWRKSTLKSLGGFDEEWEVNEDYELNNRLRKIGGKILLSPEIKCWYYVRPSLRKLAQQYFLYGFWKIKTLKKHPESLRWRQLAPFVVTMALSTSLLLLIISWPLGIIVPILYALVNVAVSMMISIKRELKYLPLLPIVFTVIHLSYGIGFITGLFKHGIPKITVSVLCQAFKTSNEIFK